MIMLFHSITAGQLFRYRNWLRFYGTPLTSQSTESRKIVGTSRPNQTFISTRMALRVNDFRHVRGILFEVSHQLQLVSRPAILLDQGGAHTLSARMRLSFVHLRFFLARAPRLYPSNVQARSVPSAEGTGKGIDDSSEITYSLLLRHRLAVFDSNRYIGCTVRKFTFCRESLRSSIDNSRH